MIKMMLVCLQLWEAEPREVKVVMALVGASKTAKRPKEILAQSL